jgi:hypothetical protein
MKNWPLATVDSASGGSIRGTGSSNPFRSAGQSSIFCIVRREKQNRCVCGASRALKVTGESTTRTNVEVFEGFLSAPQ